jgi:hypothetical protein
MKILDKILATFASQIRKSNVKLPFKSVKPHKITDDNQSIHNGVINEKLESSLRSKVKRTKQRE